VRFSTAGLLVLRDSYKQLTRLWGHRSQFRNC